MNLVVYSKKIINFYRLSKPKSDDTLSTLKRVSCHSRVAEIAQVVYDPLSPGVLLALSKSSSSLMVFEAKGSPKGYTCALKGQLRFKERAL